MLDSFTKACQQIHTPHDSENTFYFTIYLNMRGLKTWIQLRKRVCGMVPKVRFIWAT